MLLDKVKFYPTEGPQEIQSCVTLLLVVLTAFPVTYTPWTLSCGVGNWIAEAVSDILLTLLVIYNLARALSRKLLLGT